MNRDILSCSNVTKRDVFFFVRNGPYWHIIAVIDSPADGLPAKRSAEYKSICIIAAAAAALLLPDTNDSNNMTEKTR